GLGVGFRSVVPRDILDPRVEGGDDRLRRQRLDDGDDADRRRVAARPPRGGGNLGANSGDARDGIVGQGRHGGHAPDARRASQVAGTPDAWYRVRAVMRHRSARWGAVLLISTARLAYAEPVAPLAPGAQPQARAT